jgi:hypothetical protein
MPRYCPWAEWIYRDVKSPQQLAESIERFKAGFWARRRIDRPPVGIVNDGVFLPLGYLRAPLQHQTLLPSHLQAGMFASDYEFATSRQKVSCDDWIPFNAAWRAIPWLEAISGCPVRCASGSLAAASIADSLAALQQTPLRPDPSWLACLRDQTMSLNDNCPPDAWVSPTILRGPSDVLAAMRGQTEFCLDVVDSPRIVAELANRINDLLLDLLRSHFAWVKPKLGGYGHIYGYWSPAKTIVIQEDAMGMCSPRVYHDLFLQPNARIVRELGDHVLFHLHSTGFCHYREVLSIDGLAGLQLTVEANGPSLRDLAPTLKSILEKTRLILYVDSGFEHLPWLLRQLPQEGLYLLIPDRFIGSDRLFREFTKGIWA